MLNHYTDFKKIDAMDRISRLPCFIIHHIMSYLSAQEVAQTSVLSKEWSILRKSFPTLEFQDYFFLGPEPEYESEEELPLTDRPYERKENFVSFVDTSVLEFCKLKFSMQKFRLRINHPHVKELPSLLDKWLGLAVENEVKELDVHILSDIDEPHSLYTLPQTVFSAKFLTILKLSGCKLQQPSNTIRSCFLKSLDLCNVLINEQMIQKLTSECTLLESMYFDCCWGMKSFSVSNSKLLRLKIISITSLAELESLEIIVPRLQKCILNLEEQRIKPFVIDVFECSCMKELHLECAFLKEQEFHYLISKFPLLENLSVSRCNFLERVKISSTQLKNFVLDSCANLKAIDVDAPNLLSFNYSGYLTPIFSVNAPCPWNVCFENKNDFETRWFLEIKEFLVEHNEIVVLSIHVMSKKMASFNLDEFRTSLPTFPCEIENLLLIIYIEETYIGALLDGLLSICYPKNLLLRTGWEGWNEFTKGLYEKLVFRDVNCCGSCHIKCWRHYLKDIKIESFLESRGEFEKSLDIYKVMEMWPDLPWGTLKFSLDWCFPDVVEKL